MINDRKLQQYTNTVTNIACSVNTNHINIDEMNTHKYGVKMYKTKIVCNGLDESRRYRGIETNRTNLQR